MPQDPGIRDRQETRSSFADYTQAPNAQQLRFSVMAEGVPARYWMPRPPQGNPPPGNRTATPCPSPSSKLRQSLIEHRGRNRPEWEPGSSRAKRRQARGRRISSFPFWFNSPVFSGGLSHSHHEARAQNVFLEGSSNPAAGARHGCRLAGDAPSPGPAGESAGVGASNVRQ